MNKIFISILMLVFGFSQAQNQAAYIIDALRGDSVTVYEIAKEKNKKDKKETYKLGKKAFALANGTIVHINKKDTTLNYLSEKIGKDKSRNASFATVTIDGKKYFIVADALMFGDNPEDAVDFVNKHKNMHTPICRFFYSTTPFIAIIILLVIFLTSAFLADLAPFTIVAVLSLLGAVSLEIVGIYNLGTDILWWLDTDALGWGMLILLLLCFLIAVIIQICGMSIFKNRINTSDEPGAELIVWRPIIFTIIAIVIASVALLLGGMKITPQQMTINVGFAISGITVLIGMISTVIGNSKVIGKLSGFVFSLFAIIWCVGVACSIVLFIIGFLKVFLQMIIMAVAGAFGMFVLSKAQTSTPPMRFEYIDAHGGRHNNEIDCNAANRRIAEQEENGF